MHLRLAPLHHIDMRQIKFIFENLAAAPIAAPVNKVPEGRDNRALLFIRAEPATFVKDS